MTALTPGRVALLEHEATDDGNPFDATTRCRFCGLGNGQGTTGYAGERACPTCRRGGDGSADLPIMAINVWNAALAAAKAGER